MWRFLFISENTQSHVNLLNFFSLCSHVPRGGNKHADEEMESEKEEEDSEGEMESSTSRLEQAPVGGQATEPATPPLTKAQVRELRRVKKLDHSWFAGLLDS